jgi:apolipoprotein N-acyltransferase
VTDDPDDADAAAEITQAAISIGAPILIGAVLEGPGANARNAAIVWTPDGGPQSGPHGMYVKRHPVPFAEYVPLRSIARKVTKKVDLIRSDFIAGTTTGVLDMPTASGQVTLGDAICFEVAYDNLVRDTVIGGAQLLTVQTNNADFNPAEARQQLAMVRLRAVESGRDALMISTVGISGFVDSTGGQHDTTGFNVAAAEVRELRLGDQRTLATTLGEIPEFVACALAIVALVGAGVIRRRTVTVTPASPTVAFPREPAATREPAAPREPARVRETAATPETAVTDSDRNGDE